jgi:hypothetical protein
MCATRLSPRITIMFSSFAFVDGSLKFAEPVTTIGSSTDARVNPAGERSELIEAQDFAEHHRHLDLQSRATVRWLPVHQFRHPLFTGSRDP